MDSRTLSDHALVLIEGEGLPAESNIHAFLSASVTLTLGILGSSVLPVPFAFSRSGVLLGLLVSLLVGFANSLTGTLLLRAAGEVKEHTFEAVAGKAAGRFWKLLTEVTMVLLLFGTLCGDYALLADCGKRAVVELFPQHSPWITAGDGRVPMVALGLFIVFPLSCMRRIRSLEYAAMAGVGLVFVLAGVIAHEAVSAGFPAIRSGELPLVKVSLNSDLPEAVAIFSFAFYVQPMLLPLLKEMPAGRVGQDLTCRAVQLVTMVVAFMVYSVVGVFAASRYGLATEGDILVNHWLPGRWEGALAGLVAIYLSLSMVPMVMTLRYQLDSLVAGQYAPFLLRRDVFLTMASLLSSLAVALRWPTAAEKMFAVTGASAVCLVCYVIPVVVHLCLYFKNPPLERQQQREYKVGGPGWPSFGPFPAGGKAGEACARGGHAAGSAEEEGAAARGMGDGGVHATFPGAHKAGQDAAGGAGRHAQRRMQQDAAAAAAAAPLVAPPGLAHLRRGGSGGTGDSAALPMGRSQPSLAARGSLPLPVSFDEWLAAARSRTGSSGDSFTCGSLPHSPMTSEQAQQQGNGQAGGGSALESMQQLRRQYEWEQQQALQGQGHGDCGGPTETRQEERRQEMGVASVPTKAEASCLPLGSSLFQHQQQAFAFSRGVAPAPECDDGGGLEEPLLPRNESDMWGSGSGGGGWKLWTAPRPGGYPSVRDLEGQSRLLQAWLVGRHVVLPVAVMIIGSAFSLGALWLSLAALLHSREH